MPRLAALIIPEKMWLDLPALSEMMVNAVNAIQALSLCCDMRMRHDVCCAMKKT
jgi:hypothetical protein